ncbi:DUF2509 family protein [Sodalis glossinidius]|nr:hypothetical protein [Sodalis glossinidius]
MRRERGSGSCRNRWRWPARHGECRQHPAEPLRVCLQASKRGYGWLLCGEGGGTLMAPPLRYYQRVTLHRAEVCPAMVEHTASGNTTVARPDVLWPALGASAAVDPLPAPGDAPAEGRCWRWRCSPSSRWGCWSTGSGWRFFSGAYRTSRWP